MILPSVPDMLNRDDVTSGINWQEMCWPGSKLDQVLEQIAIHAGLATMSQTATESIKSPPSELTSQWIITTADRLGMLAEAVYTPYVEAETTVRKASPALFCLTRPFPDHQPHYLIALKGRGRWVTVLCPDLSKRQLSAAHIRAAWCYSLENQGLAGLGGLWEGLGLSAQAQESAETAVSRTTLNQTPIDGCWLFYPPPHANLWQQMRRSSTHWLLLLMVLVNILQQTATVGGWAIIGNGALTGWFDRAALLAWVLLMFTGVWFQAITYNLQGPLATSTLRLIKSRLLYGTLQLEPDEIRHQGSGQFFGRVLESDMVQNYLVGGALVALPFGVMLIMAGAILWFGAGGWLHTLLLAIWTVVACYVGWRRLRHGTAGMSIYRGMTNDLVENMLGHRTRLAQESRRNWHEAEDKSLAHYTDMSRHFDRNGAQLDVLIPRGWLVLGLIGIAYPFITMATSLEKLAISVGGILLATMAFDALAQAMKFFAQAIISWQQIAPLLWAANKTASGSAVSNILPKEQSLNEDHRQPMMMLRDVTFRYHERSQAVLQNCHLTIMPGDQLLLEGPSGGGKSTLASILCGLRQPESGLLLLWGFDAHTVGTALWRQRIATAPQFQENHLFTDTFAFNLLMGRHWPPTDGDLEDAEQICRELGLGDLLDRMPDGLNQLIGDGGWQLSFGERSRLFIARALLQNADLVILDESFGSLDPESLRQAMQCVLRWTTTLIVIAHP